MILFHMLYRGWFFKHWLNTEFGQGLANTEVNQLCPPPEIFFRVERKATQVLPKNYPFPSTFVQKMREKYLIFSPASVAENL